ncbi:MAG: 6-phosphofructokinase [Clostridia bacterium]|nr:6-phosphofructokinase [Clostridia bacterium]MBR5277728.1 6-phosphofructokinase [Clostridia bacterium]
MKQIKRIGVLTSGGDAPGMNAAVRAVTRLAIYKGIEVMGIYNGYQGLIEGNIKQLHERDVSFIINRGGTMLYSARSKEFCTPEGMAKAVANCDNFGIDGIVTIGGDGTFRGAVDLTTHGVPCIGIPGTIDNDIASTESTIGFDTAMNTVVDLVDKLRDTSESHSRCTVVEVMGRDAGDIALQTSIALGAVTAVIKEIPTDFDHVIEKMIDARKGGKRNFIIITSEGMGRDYGEELARMIEARSGIESRFARLAHIQRGGAPTLRDRVLATQMGCAAVENLVDGQMKQVMCLRGNNIVAMDIYDALTVDKLMKGKLKPEEEEQISPNKLYEMKRIVADKQAYKNYLNYIIDHITL